MKEFLEGNFLKEIRYMNNLNQVDMCSLLDMSQSHYAGIESASKTLKWSLAIKIVELTHENEELRESPFSPYELITNQTARTFMRFIHQIENSLLEKLPDLSTTAEKRREVEDTIQSLQGSPLIYQQAECQKALIANPKNEMLRRFCVERIPDYLRKTSKKLKKAFELANITDDFKI